MTIITAGIGVSYLMAHFINSSWPIPLAIAAAKLGIVDSMYVEMRSRRGKAKFPAKVTKAIAPGTVFVPMHWDSLWAGNF